MDYKGQIEVLLKEAEEDVKAGRVALMEITFSDLRKILDDEMELPK